MKHSRPTWRATLLAVTTVIATAITVAPPTRHTSAAARPSPEVIALANLRHITLVQAQQWLTSQALAQTIAPAFRRQLGAQFAGIWLDPARPGRIEVATTGRTGAVTQIAMNMGPGVAELVDAVHSAASLADLIAVQTDVVNTLRSIRGATGLIVDVEAHRGATVLTVGPRAAALGAVQQAIATLQARHGARLMIIHGRAEPTADACAGAYCDSPLRGGVRIDHGGPYCTAGFTAKQGTSRYLVTAGHCLTGGGTWSTLDAGGTPHTVGPVATAKFPGPDAGTITVSNVAFWNPKPWIYVRPPLATSSSYLIKGIANAIPFSFVCHTGATTGSTCGLVMSTLVWVSYSNGGFVFPAIKVVGWCAKGGDSGGPVYAQNKAYALHSGSVNSAGNCNKTSFEYPIAFALAVAGVQLLVAS